MQYKRWKQKVNKAIHACFKNIRLTDTKEDDKIEKLMKEKKNILKKRTLPRYEEDKVQEIETQITKEITDKELEKLLKVTGELDAEPNTSIWKEMTKSYPKNNKAIPTGVLNIQGKVITIPNEKKSKTLVHFEHRMRKRKVKEEVEELVKIEKSLFNKRIDKAEEKTQVPLLQ